jgi:hypothetical protein
MAVSKALEYPLKDGAVRTTIQTAGGIASTDTSFDVGEVTGAPAPPFLIAVYVDQTPLREDAMELMVVEAVSGTTLTVSRGAKGTPAQSFSQGDRVFMAVAPADSFDHKRRPVANVLAYGAKADGSTDDSAAFQSAVDDLKATEGSGVVYVPDKELGFALGASVKLPSGIVVRGDNNKYGSLSRVKPVSGYDGLLFESKGTGRVEGIGLIGLFFDGSQTTLTAVSLHAKGALIKGCRARDMYTTAFKFTGTSSKPALDNTVSDCFIEGNLARFFFGVEEKPNSSGLSVRNTRIEGVNGSGLRSDGNRTLVSENEFVDCNKGIESYDASQKRILANHFRNIGEEAIWAKSGSAVEGALDSKIANNEFRNVNTTGNVNSVIYIKGFYLNRLHVTGNQAWRDDGTTHTALNLLYSEKAISSLVMRDNTLDPDFVTGGEFNDLLWPRGRAKEHAIGDDGVATITPQEVQGKLTVSYQSGPLGAQGIAASIFVDANGGAFTEVATGGSTSVTGGSLSGTTGTDGELTIGVKSDGTVDIENRAGGEITVAVRSIK